MEAMDSWLNTLLNKNRKEFSKWHDLKWANSYIADEMQKKREKLLIDIGESTLYKETKPYYNHISKGCEICASGKWSCLFITNKCNAKCFYCPVSQDIDEVPSTQSLNFENPDDYANYINHFQFQGVSFSGGEPLLYFDRTLEYLKTVREKCNSDLYIWMYTNGILVDENKLKKLATYNLNEIRFDIGAIGYKLDKVKLAKGIIPNISIEVPCIPEEKDRIISMLPEMIDAGVTNLNLHHLRLTLFNADKLVKRRYTIINAERPLVMESETAALEIINAAREKGFNIGINYCSFHYKNRFQKAGYRTTITQKIFPYADITENGFIREYDGKMLCYKELKIIDKSKALANVQSFNFEGNDYLFTLKTVFYETDLSVEQKIKIDELLNNAPKIIPKDTMLFKIWQCEYIEHGLREL